MTKEERELSIEYLEKIKEDYIEGNAYERHPLPEYYAIENAIKALKQEAKWIPVKTRKLTRAEEQEMLERSNYFFDYAFDCKLPEDGEEVLVTISTGEVTTTTFFNEGLDGCYFEYYEDDGDVIAWMPKPKAYKAESEG